MSTPTEWPIVFESAVRQAFHESFPNRPPHTGSFVPWEYAHIKRCYDANMSVTDTTAELVRYRTAPTWSRFA